MRPVIGTTVCAMHPIADCAADAGRHPILAAEARRAIEVMVPMRDGIRLATDVYLPTGAGDSRGRVPVVIARVPYDKRGEVSFLPPIAGLLNDRGLALVAQDVRGKFCSEGIAVPIAQELTDGADTIDWIVRQSWCDGRVVPFGDSYGGFTAWAAAASGHPAVAAVCPRVTTLAIARDWMYRGGVFRLQLIAGWAAFAWSGSDLANLELDWSVRPLRELVQRALPGRSSPLEDWRRRPATESAWVDVAAPPSALARQVRAPVLLSGGWWDVFQRGLIEDWIALRALGSLAHLRLEASDHEFHRWADTPAVDLSANPELRARRLPELLQPTLDFVRTVLRGENPGGPAVQWEVTNGPWRASDSWPPPGRRDLLLQLVDAARALLGPEGGGLAERGHAGRTSVDWTHDAEDLVPSLDPYPWAILTVHPDERDVEIRDDVLTFTGDPAFRAFDIVGRCRAVLEIGARSRSTHVMAKLVDVYPEGTARRILEGARAVTLDGRTASVEIDLGYTAYRVRPGHRLRLEVAASSFPRYLWHPGTDEEPWDAVAGAQVEHRLIIGDGASYLVLPVART